MLPFDHITDSNEHDFGHFIESVSGGDAYALKNLNYVVMSMFKAWGRRERQELRWIADGSKCIDYGVVVQTIIADYLEKYRHNTVAHSFAGFREYAVNEFRIRIGTGFAEFLKLLKENNHKAWKIVYEDLQSRSASWFYKRNHSLNGGDYSVFSSSMEIIYSKLMENKVTPSDAGSFKSYFFRILENKVMESLKDPFRKRFVPLEEAGIMSIINQESEYSASDDESTITLTGAMKNLKADERLILDEYYYGGKSLKEIAGETNQREENVRIKKFRALKKLTVYFKKAGYGS